MLKLIKTINTSTFSSFKGSVMNYSNFFFLSFLFSSLATAFNLNQDAQQKLTEFTKTDIVFTRAGTTAFIQNCLNDSLYSRLFLPSCFDHLIDFLEFGKSLSQRTEFDTEVLGLFHQELKQTTWVNAFAFVRFLDKLPHLIDTQDTRRAAAKEVIKNTIHTFLEKTDVSLDMLAEELLTLQIDFADNSELYPLLLRFLEQACDKLIWSPEDKEVTWECCVLLGNQLERLHHAGHIPTVKKLNALCWSLVSRYAYFIETNVKDLSLATLENIQKSLQSETPSWLLIPEPEQNLRAKKEYLEQVLFEADFELRSLGQ